MQRTDARTIGPLTILPRLVIVLPCYKEAETIPHTYCALQEVLEGMVLSGKTAEDWGLCFVDDGSEDGTWEAICTLTQTDDRVFGIRLPANTGQQEALLAGLEACNGHFDVYATMDVDLQDDPAALPTMLAALQSASSIAYGVRSNRNADGWGKRISASIYYRLLRGMDIQVIPHHADYRMFRQDVLSALLAHPHAHLFLRAVITKLGFRGAIVPYRRLARTHGSTKYSLWKMCSLAIDGLTLYRSTPLKLVFLFGLIGGFAAVVCLVWVLGLRLQGNPGSPELFWVAPLLFLAGLQCIAIAVAGEYLRRQYLENLRRPQHQPVASVGHASAQPTSPMHLHRHEAAKQSGSETPLKRQPLAS